MSNPLHWTFPGFSTKYIRHPLVDSCRLRPRPFLQAGRFMTLQPDDAKGREIVSRWCALAEQRLDYLTKLFDSGRWRRFHSEQGFLENIREAKAAVQAWRDLLSREASRDNRTIDLSWLGRGQTTVPMNEFRRVAAPLRQVSDIPIVPPQEIASILAVGNGAVSETRSAKPLPEEAFTAALDLSPIATRYPLLRNTL